MAITSNSNNRRDAGWDAVGDDPWTWSSWEPQPGQGGGDDGGWSSGGRGASSWDAWSGWSGWNARPWDEWWDWSNGGAARGGGGEGGTYRGPRERDHFVNLLLEVLMQDGTDEEEQNKSSVEVVIVHM